MPFSARTFKIIFLHLSMNKCYLTVTVCNTKRSQSCVRYGYLEQFKIKLESQQTDYTYTYTK